MRALSSFEMQMTGGEAPQWFKCASAIAGVAVSAAGVIVTFVPTAGLLPCLLAGTGYGLALNTFKSWC